MSAEHEAGDFVADLFHDPPELDHEGGHDHDHDAGDVSGEPVKVELAAPANAGYRTLTVDETNNPQRILLPRDAGRRRAVVVAVDNPVILSASYDRASDIARNQQSGAPLPDGFYLPTGLPGVVLESQQETWVSATASGSSRVSVCSERG